MSFLQNRPASLNFAANRILREIQSYLKTGTRQEEQTFWIRFDPENITEFQVLIKGPKKTPYEGGFFHFSGKFPAKYPHSPPVMKFLTTGMGKQRLHPNLYANGKICLSILGTWPGPSWKCVMSLESVVLSIQSLLSENPIIHEPGFSEVNCDTTSAINYNRYVKYATLKYAVVEHVTGKSRLPCEFQDVVNDAAVLKSGGYYTRLFKNYVSEYTTQAGAMKEKNDLIFDKINEITDKKNYKEKFSPFDTYISRLEINWDILGNQIGEFDVGEDVL